MKKAFLVFYLFAQAIFAQNTININRLNWLPESHSFWVNEQDNIAVYDAEKLSETKIVLTKDQMKASGFKGKIEKLVWNNTKTKVLIYTNSKRVWRANTKGDYWFFDLTSGKGFQLGKELEASTLMFAKFSNDNKNIAYVSKHNIYLENLENHKIKQLTKDGTAKIINGTFDWVYEEELACRDGFRWSPDGNSIAYWRVDATDTKYHLMINNIDSLYSYVVPVEYPKAGEKPSSVKIGVVNIATEKTNWMAIPGDADNNYLPRMEWIGKNELMVVQLNRRQNEANLYNCDSNTGKASLIYNEKSNAWIDVYDNASGVYDGFSCTLLDNGKSFLWNSDADGWMHTYKISMDGMKKELITKENFDSYFIAYNIETRTIYSSSSPTDATQKYLYETSLDTKKTKRTTPVEFDGTNEYSFSPDGAFAKHTNSNINRLWNSRLVALKNHKKVYPLVKDVFAKPERDYSLEKFKIKTIDNVELDGIMAKPLNFDASKKYPVFFYVYGEPAGAVANDEPSFNEYIASLIPQGYIGIAMDNRGTPVMKGTEWRKCIYKNIGIINTRDQAMAAKEIMKWNFIDTDRVAVHGWSGGGAVTLNLLFQYPDIYKTGVAVSAVSDQHFYDNIYTERYMGLPSENEAAYKQASPITYAQNLKGNLLYMHGTGDDNVHYKNAEVLIDKLIKYNKMFNLMIYPNRAHGIFEGEGTRKHLNDTFMKFIKEYSPPGAK